MLEIMRKSLGNKIMTVVTASLALVMGMEILFKVYWGNRDMISVIEIMASDLAILTYAGIEYPMSVGDSKAVVYALSDVRERMKGIEVFICDEKERITWSTHVETMNKDIADTITNEAALQALRQTLETGEAPRSTLIDQVGGDRCIVIIQPVFNKKSCHQCHDPFKKILGGIVVRTNAEENFTEIATSLRRTVFTTILGITGTIIMIYLMVWKFILRPVVNLTSAVKRVSGGDLEFEIHSDSKDEIGMLARSINQMTQDLKSARDEITRWTETLEDLVDERTAQLKRAQENAIRSEKMASLGRLAAIVAHEINNPLAGIRTYAKLLIKKSSQFAPCIEPKYIEQLKTIESESARCGEIVRNLLQFARPAKPKVSRHDINTLVRESLQLVQHKIQMTNIELINALAPEPIEVNCDGQKIKQALVALLLNACEAVIQSELGTIEVRSEDLPHRGGVAFSITDNGVGMDEETRAHMFEPFFSTKEKLVDNGTGMNIGLGVSVVYEIIKSHHGDIQVDSELGRGTTITIFLYHNPAMGTEEG